MIFSKSSCSQINIFWTYLMEINWVVKTHGSSWCTRISIKLLELWFPRVLQKTSQSDKTRNFERRSSNQEIKYGLDFCVCVIVCACLCSQRWFRTSLSAHVQLNLITWSFSHIYIFSLRYHYRKITKRTHKQNKPHHHPLIANPCCTATRFMVLHECGSRQIDSVYVSCITWAAPPPRRQIWILKS